MDKCTYRLSLDELISRPAVELRLVGADGEEDKDTSKSGSDDSDDGEDNEEDSESDEDGDNKSKGKKAEPDAKDKKIAALEDEKQRHYDLRKEAEAKLREANEEIARLKRDGVEDATLKQENETLSATNQRLTDQNMDLRIEIAFLKSNKHQWRDAAAALKLADLSKVEFDDKTDEVHGLETALDRLAANAPYLLVEDQSKDDSKDDKDEKKPRRTGTAPRGKDRTNQSTSGDLEAKRAKYAGKYAGLRR